MQITIESTDRIVEVNGVPGRVWSGKSPTGVPISCVITRIAVPTTAPEAEHERFAQELSEVLPAPEHAVEAFPLRMVL